MKLIHGCLTKYQQDPTGINQIPCLQSIPENQAPSLQQYCMIQLHLQLCSLITDFLTY